MISKSRFMARIMLLVCMMSTGQTLYAGKFAVPTSKESTESGPRTGTTKQPPRAQLSANPSLASRFKRGVVSLGGEFALQTTSDFLFKGSFSPYVVLTHILATRALQMSGVSGTLSKLPYVGMYLPGAAVQSLTNRVATGSYDPFGVVKGIGAMMLLRKLAPYLIEGLKDSTEQQIMQPALQGASNQAENSQVLSPVKPQGPAKTSVNQQPVSTASVNTAQQASASISQPFYDVPAFVKQLGIINGQLSAAVPLLSQQLFGKTIREVIDAPRIPALIENLNAQRPVIQQVIGQVGVIVTKLRALMPFSPETRMFITATLQQAQQFEAIQAQIDNINKMLAQCDVLYKITFVELGFSDPITSQFRKIWTDPIGLAVINEDRAW